MAQGWECPKCGSVYAPYISECKRCANSNAYQADQGGSSSTKDWKITVRDVRDANVLFEELYRFSHTNTQSVKTAPQPVTLTSGEVTRGFAGEA